MGISQRTSVGTAILADRVTAPLIMENGILTEGRVQYITLHLPDSSELTIINTYAPRSSKDSVTTPLWPSVRMKLTLPKLGTWSPPGLPQLQSSTTESKTPWFEMFFILLERS
jgi:hypothetical protein